VDSNHLNRNGEGSSKVAVESAQLRHTELAADYILKTTEYAPNRKLLHGHDCYELRSEKWRSKI
jgi:hypothetical protein